MKQDLPTLLQGALSSLAQSADAQKREKTFTINQGVIRDIKQGNSQTIAGNLQIKPSIRGEADAQEVLPLVQSESFDVDLSAISVPKQCGSGTLKELIIRLCAEYMIVNERGADSASLTTVVTAMAGSHPESDVDCSGVTEAEFVPVFNSDGHEKRVLAISYTMNGETGLRLDHLKVRGSMTCLNRQGKTAVPGASTIKAIEIPTQIEQQLEASAPASFEQLKQNESVVVFVEYDLISEEPAYKGFAEPVTYRGDTTRGGGSRGLDSLEEHSFKSDSRRVASYSVMGQGSSTTDHSTTISEKGRRVLKKISVYKIGAMVVNTNSTIQTVEDCQSIILQMKARAEELNAYSLPFKLYTYAQLVADLNTHLLKYHFNTHYSDIFEHTLLRIANIVESPMSCHFGDSTKTPENCFLDLQLSLPSIYQFVYRINQHFGPNSCEYTPQFNRNGIPAVRLSLMSVLKNMALIKQNMDEILAHPRDLSAYVKYSERKSPGFEAFQRKIRSIGQSFGLSTENTDFVEITILRMFECKEELTKARFQQAEGYVGKMLDVEFFINISEVAARQLIDTINQQFPSDTNPARFLYANARFIDIGNVHLCQFSIDADIWVSEPFLKRFKMTLEQIADAEPGLFERLRIESGTQKKPAKEHAMSIDSIAKRCTTPELPGSEGEPPPKERLVSALCQFGAIISAPKALRREKAECSETLRRAISNYESHQSQDQNRLFKTSVKKEIKIVQRDLGFLPK